MDRTFHIRSPAARIFLLAVLFGGEAFLATLQFDGATPVPSGAWIAALVHSWGPSVARFAIAFSALFATFAFLQPQLLPSQSDGSCWLRTLQRWEFFRSHRWACMEMV